MVSLLLQTQTLSLDPHDQPRRYLSLPSTSTLLSPLSSLPYHWHARSFPLPPLSPRTSYNLIVLTLLVKAPLRPHQNFTPHLLTSPPPFVLFPLRVPFVPPHILTQFPPSTSSFHSPLYNPSIQVHLRTPLPHASPSSSPSSFSSTLVSPSIPSPPPRLTLVPYISSFVPRSINHYPNYIPFHQTRLRPPSSPHRAPPPRRPTRTTLQHLPPRRIKFPTSLTYKTPAFHLSFLSLLPPPSHLLCNATYKGM